jgi:TolB protein
MHGKRARHFRNLPRLLRGMGGVLTLAALLFVSLRGIAPAQDVIITSEQKGTEVLALGQIDFVCAKGNPKSLTLTPGEVLGSDLDFSGRFRIVRAPTLTPAAKALFAQEGALAYLRGEYTLEADRYALLAELVDLETGEIILRKKFTGPRGQIRRAAHQFADEMVYQLFGEKGFAQTRIAYVNRRGGAKEIWVMDYDGAEPAAVTRNGSINLGPLFAGARDRLLFTSYMHGTPQFYFTDPDRSAPQPAFSSRGMNSAPAYNRNDKEIAFASTMDGNSEIYRRAAGGGGRAERLTFSWSIETSPSWAPNGQEIVFVSDRSGKPMLYIMDRDGSNTRRITYDFAYCGSPTWSPKGDRIAFSAMDDGNNFSIYTIAPDGTDAVRVASGGSNESPAWSPDGRYLAFSSTRTGQAEIYAIRADGMDLRRLTWSGGNTMPSWSEY